MRLFKKDPPPGWKSPARERAEAIRRLRNAPPRTAYAAVTMAKASARMEAAHASLARTAIKTQHRSTASPMATATGPTDSVPWTAADIEDAKRRIAAREEYERLRDG